MQKVFSKCFTGSAPHELRAASGAKPGVSFDMAGLGALGPCLGPSLVPTAFLGELPGTVGADTNRHQENVMGCFMCASLPRRKHHLTKLPTTEQSMTSTQNQITPLN